MIPRVGQHALGNPHDEVCNGFVLNQHVLNVLMRAEATSLRLHDANDAQCSWVACAKLRVDDAEIDIPEITGFVRPEQAMKRRKELPPSRIPLPRRA